MPVQVDVQTLAVIGGQLTFGSSFVWVNNSSSVVNLTCCQSFCTQGSFTVPPASNGQPGTAQATLRPTAGFYFGDSAFTAPGMPHLQVGGSMPIPVAEEKDVA